MYRKYGTIDSVKGVYPTDLYQYGTGTSHRQG
jgi:hypothetical protein